MTTTLINDDHHPPLDGTGRRKIGDSVMRKEDDRFIRGQGQYSDDLNKPGQLYGVFVRAIQAHAVIKSIATAAAAARPGVVAVLTGADYAADGMGPILHTAIEGSPIDWRQKSFTEDDPVALSLPQWPLPTDKVRHIGEPVALVVADTLAAAWRGAETVQVTLEDLPVVVDVAQAGAPDAPLVNDQAPGNLCIHHFGGDAEQTAAALAQAATVVSGEFAVSRTVCAQMEPRSGIAEYDPGQDKYIVTAGNQGVYRFRQMISGALKVALNQVQVICPDTGGGFGARGHIGPECPVLAWAAKRLGRPIKWTSDRLEAFVSDWQGRDMVLKGELGLDGDGKFTAYRLQILCNNGAHTICYAPPANASRLVTTVYDIGTASLELRAYLSNTLPVLPYRAAGRPEVTYAIERLIDMAATATGIDRHQLRARNLVGAAAMPFTNPMGLTYDVGDFGAALDQMAALCDWPGFEARRQEAAGRGMLRGISLVPFVESPVGAPIEFGRLEIAADGETVIYAGTQNHGQGHATTYAQVVSDLLGIPFEKISLAIGDSENLPGGGGTHSDRSMRMMGTVLFRIAEDVVAQTKPIAGQLLQADPADVGWADGRFRADTSGQEVERCWK